MSEQRAAIVTGASSGIGLAIADVLGQEGYALTVAARRPEKLEAAAAGLREKGYDVETVAGPLGDEDGVKAVVAAHRERYGRLDVLVNNAGVGIGAQVAEIDTKKLDMQLGVNLRSIILFYRETVDLLRAAGKEHGDGARGQHGVDRRQARPAVAVGLLGDQGRGGRLHRGHAQGAVGRGDQVHRPVPGLRRHADDRVRQAVRSPPRT